MKAKVKTIDIQAKEWFDKVNGNSYFSMQVTINYQMKSEQTFKFPLQYGYGETYIDVALNYLHYKKLIPETNLYTLRYKGFIIRKLIQLRCLKKEVINHGI